MRSSRGMEDLEILSLPFRVELAAIAESGEENVDVVLRGPVAGHQEIALRPAQLVDKGGRRRPLGIVEHGLVQRRQYLLELIL